jgi:hypothetical protein
LSGGEVDLIRGLSRLCSPKIGQTFGAKMNLKGNYEGRTILYKSDSYPNNCIGPVRFIWKKQQCEKERSLWIWSHPSIYKQIEQQLLAIFQFKLNENNQKSSLKLDKTDETIETNDQNDDIINKKRRLTSSSSISTEKKLKQEPQASEQTKQNYISLKNETQIFEMPIEMKLMKDKLIRFKLIGPMSTTILGNVLQTVNISTNEAKKYDYYQKQADLWNSLKFNIKNPNEITPSTIISLLVNDPRFFLPKKKSFNRIEKQLKKSNQLQSSNNFLKRLLI